jgi:hypothetical protein
MWRKELCNEKSKLQREVTTGRTAQDRVDNKFLGIFFEGRAYVFHSLLQLPSSAKNVIFQNAIKSLL